jgi:hypothetical protein
MAAQYFHFPTSATTYKLPSGDTLRFRLWYDDGTALSNTDTNVKLLKCGNLDIPLEITPSSQTFRFSKIKLEFENTSDRFDTGDIFDVTYSNDTYFELYLNGSLYFYGMVDFSSIKNDDWYVVGGSLKSRKISFSVNDILSYFWTRSRTFTAASITGSTFIDTQLEEIFADVGIASGNVNIDSNIGWTEFSGGVHTLSTLKWLSGGSIEISTYLKYVMLYFGCFIYYLNGKINIVSRISGTTKTVNNSDIVKPISKIENQDLIEYIRVGVTAPSIGADVPIANFVGTEDVSFAAGADNGNNNKNFDLGLDNSFIKFIVSDQTATRYPSSGNDSMTGGSVTTLIDSSYDFETNNWECGDYVENATNSEGAIVYDLNDANTVLHSTINTANGNLDFWYGYKGDNNDYRYKYYKVAETARDVYDEFLRTSPDILKIRVRDLTDFDDIEKRYVLLSANHRAKNVKIDFEQDEIQLELRQVA